MAAIPKDYEIDSVFTHNPCHAYTIYAFANILSHDLYNHVTVSLIIYSQIFQYDLIIQCIYLLFFLLYLYEMYFMACRYSQ